MAGRDETPRLRPRRKTPNAQLPVTTCPHCRREDVQVMPGRRLALHPARSAWKTAMCRGGGELIGTLVAPPIRPRRSTKRGR